MLVNTYSAVSGYFYKIGNAIAKKISAHADKYIDNPYVLYCSYLKG